VRGRKSQGGEQTRGRISQAQGANKPGGEPAKRRKSQTPSEEWPNGTTYINVGKQGGA